MVIRLGWGMGLSLTLLPLMVCLNPGTRPAARYRIVSLAASVPLMLEAGNSGSAMTPLPL